MEKGDFKTECNRTVCTDKNAVYYNHSTRKFYCPSCAHLINHGNQQFRIENGHDLCEVRYKSENNLNIERTDSDYNVMQLRIGNAMQKRGKVLLLTLGILNKLVKNPPSKRIYTPILITEEILQSLGYVKHKDHFHLQLHCIWKCNDMFICDKNGTQLKYVHQLQNLLYFTKGYELILTP